MKLTFHRRVFWWFAGLFLLAIAVAVWRIEPLHSLELSMPSSSRQHVAHRDPEARNPEVGRLMRRYREKTERGMTDREILSILNEFEATGIGTPPEVVPLDGSFREKQQEWYLAALDEALNLTPAQLRQARERMRRMLEEDAAAFAKGIAAEGSRGIPNRRWPNDKTIAPFNINPLLWLSKESYAPWQLMDLTAEQEKLTVKSLGEEGWSSALPLPEDSGDRIALFVPGILARTPTQPVSGIFHGSSYSETARHLHPAQLRLALFGGELSASLLQNELDQPYPGVSEHK